MRRITQLLSLLILSFVITTGLQAQTTIDGEAETMMGFAQSVAISEGTIFIGEPNNVHQPGVVYVYTRSEDGWVLNSTLMAENGVIGDGFGTIISADGNKILVGAPDVNNDQGAVYVFEQNSDGNWNQTASLPLPEGANESAFGESVLLINDMAYVGAPDFNEEQGAVIVYKRTDSGDWYQTSVIVNPETATEINFGGALSMNGSRLVVGADRMESGVAFVYNNSEGGWDLEATLMSDLAADRARFGSSVLIHGNEILIGAPRDAGNAGAVYVFNRDEDSGNWNSSNRLMAFDSRNWSLFGSSLAYSGSELWIGSPNADGFGAIYRMMRSDDGSGWSGVMKMNSTVDAMGGGFSSTMAISGDLAIVGLTGADYGAGSAAILARNTATGEWISESLLMREEGSILEPITGGMVECMDGTANIYGCENVNLLSFLPIEDIGGERGVRLNDMWGWTDPETGKEYALVGRNEGTSFVDVSDPLNPVYVGNLQKPDSSRANVWRDIKVYKNHAYVVADGAGPHGMQVLDLTQLREFDGEPLEFEETTHYDNIGSAHNVIINEDSGFAFIVGSSGGGQTCGGGLHMVNIQDPANPVFAGCFADPSTGRSGTGYSHDAQCVIYDGPDEEHKGSEICMGANETAISIADVSDKDNPVALSTASYPDYGYVHQGWLTEDHRYFFQNDELDELQGKVDQTRTIIWDVTDLDDPQFVREYLFGVNSSDHNLYIHDNIMYQSNYVSGLQIFDVSDPEDPNRIGYFDTHPFTEDAAGFAGSWSNYPYFESGIVLMTSGNEGLFILDTKK